jgi:hypothetical protein
MLGKLKDMAGSAALEKAIASLEPTFTEHVSKVQSLGADVIRDDVRYAQFVVEPTYLAILSASSGATKLIPEFKDRFSRLMLRVRDDLLVLEGTTVSLVEDFKAKLPKVLTESLKS